MLPERSEWIRSLIEIASKYESSQAQWMAILKEQSDRQLTVQAETNVALKESALAVQAMASALAELNQRSRRYAKFDYDDGK